MESDGDGVLPPAIFVFDAAQAQRLLVAAVSRGDCRWGFFPSWSWTSRYGVVCRPEDGQYGVADRPNSGQRGVADRPDGEQRGVADKPEGGQRGVADKHDGGGAAAADRPNSSGRTSSDRPGIGGIGPVWKTTTAGWASSSSH
jgi:hypothetical protein